MGCLTTWDLGGCGCSCSVTISVLCGGKAIAGASVEIEDGNQTVVASGTTDASGSVALPIPSAGNYTVVTSGTGCSGTLSTALALACGGSYPVQCCCTATLCVTACPTGAPLGGSTVTVNGTGYTTSAQGGCVLFPIAANTAYPVQVTAAGYQTWSGSLSFTCGETLTIPLQPTTAQATISIPVQGCCAVMAPGCTVNLSDGQITTTDSTGTASFWVGKSGTYTFTVAKSRWATYTGTVTVQVDCTTAQASPAVVALTPASGYVCGAGCPGTKPADKLADPVPTTLHLTDSVYGACTLTWNGSNAWVGTTTTSTDPTQHGTPAGTCPQSPFTITYSLSSCGALTVTFPVRDCGQCIGGGFQDNFYQAPGDSGTACPASGQVLSLSSSTGGMDGTQQPSTCALNSASVPLDMTISQPILTGGTFTLIYAQNSTTTWHITE